MTNKQKYQQSSWKQVFAKYEVPVLALIVGMIFGATL